MTVAPRFFVEAMAFLKAGYPSYRPSDDEWKAVVARYALELARYPHEVVRSAFARSSQAFPEWFPALGKLRELVDAEHKTWLSVQSRKAAPSAGLLPEHMPSPVLDDDNPFEQLARRYEKGERVDSETVNDLLEGAGLGRPL